ncbi:MAG: hypothetical protein RL143_1278 [Pseudomonadota bacterium]
MLCIQRFKLRSEGTEPCETLTGDLRNIESESDACIRKLELRYEGGGPSGT